MDASTPSLCCKTLQHKEIFRRGRLLTALLTDAQWDLHQLNLTPNANPALLDDTTPRPNVATPADHPANATNAVVRIYERAVAIHDECLNGLTTLLDALIASIGPANALLLADPVNGVLLVTCVDIINMTTVKHGTPQASDISHLKHQLSLPLKHLNDYTAHLSNFKENLVDLDFFQLPIPACGQFTTFL
jgi:hypothetical protein